MFLPNWGIASTGNEAADGVANKPKRKATAWCSTLEKVPSIISCDLSAVADASKKIISGVHKRCWKYIPIPKRIEESASKQDMETVA